jgi:hypothetical protein
MHSGCGRKRHPTPGASSARRSRATLSRPPDSELRPLSETAGEVTPYVPLELRVLVGLAGRLCVGCLLNRPVGKLTGRVSQGQVRPIAGCAAIGERSFRA